MKTRCEEAVDGATFAKRFGEHVIYGCLRAADPSGSDLIVVGAVGVASARLSRFGKRAYGMKWLCSGWLGGLIRLNPGRSSQIQAQKSGLRVRTLALHDGVGGRSRLIKVDPG